jgi:hypothetical protein
MLKRKNIAFASLLGLLVTLTSCPVISTGCSSSSRPVSNLGPSSNPLPADQSLYEPLHDAAPRHYLKDEAGNDTTMWARLISVSPDRGSALTYGNTNGICPTKCQQYLVEAGMDKTDTATNPSNFWLSWSEDCVNGREDLWNNGVSVPSGSSSTFGANDIHYFRDFAPKCFFVRGRYPEKGTIVPKSGTTVLVLDYRPPN